MSNEMKNKKCFLCESDNIRGDVGVVADIWPDNHTVAWCNNCELYFLEEMPSIEEIEYYYKKEYHQYSPIVSFMKGVFRNFRSKSQYKYLTDVTGGKISGKKILEIGSGDGRFLGLFAGDNEVVGTEYSPKFKEFAKRKYGLDFISKDILELDGKFDFILMSHVLEHFTDIEAVLDKSKKLLNEEGYFFIEVPNSPKPDDIDKSELDNYLATAHTYNFRKKSIQNIVEKSGFEVVSMERFYYNFPEYYSTDKRRSLAKVFLEGSRISPNLVFGILRYIFLSFVFPHKSYKINSESVDYSGLGDNIRIILKKK